MFCCVNKLLCTVCNWLTVQGFLLLTYSVSCWVSRLCQMWQLVVLYQHHWLSVPERIQFKLAVLVFCCLHGTAPPYLADQLQPVAALESRRMLRSSASARLDIPRVRRTTIGDRAFCVAILASGTVCRHRRRVHLRCLFLGSCWNANCSIAVTICANW